MDEIVPLEDRVAQLVNEQLADMDRIKRGLRKGGDPNLVWATKNVFGTHKDLMKAAEKCHNGWKKGKPKRMRECVTGANGVMGGYIRVRLFCSWGVFFFLTRTTTGSSKCNQGRRRKAQNLC